MVIQNVVTKLSIPANQINKNQQNFNNFKKHVKKHFLTKTCLTNKKYIYIYIYIYTVYMPVPVAARFKAWVCDRTLGGIAGSNPTRGMDVCLL